MRFFTLTFLVFGFMLAAPALSAVDWEAEYWTGFGFEGGGYIKGLFSSDMINTMAMGGGLSHYWFCFTERHCIGFWWGAALVFPNQKIYNADNTNITLTYSINEWLGTALRLPLAGGINGHHHLVFSAALDFIQYLLENSKDGASRDFNSGGFAFLLSAGYKFDFYDDKFFLMLGSHVQFDIFTTSSNNDFSGFNMIAVKPYVTFGINFYRYYKIEGNWGKGW
ncbi:MAG: hypothetical protein LBG74_03555 [Spirochaetaceae bacterium]|nr:hypothetical protein [Spirochaetaceae bacterium]